MTPDKPVSKRTNLTTDDLVGHLFATMDCGRHPCPICAAIRDGLKERDAALSDLAALKAENAKLKQHNELLWTMENEVAEKVKAENERLKEECEECIAVRPERLKQLADESAKWRVRTEKAEADLAAMREENERLTKDRDYWKQEQGRVHTHWRTAETDLKKAEAERDEWERKWGELVETVARRTDQAGGSKC